MTMAKETAEAIYGLMVDAFLEGVTDFFPEPGLYGLSPSEGAKICSGALASSLAQSSGLSLVETTEMVDEEFAENMNKVIAALVMDI